MFRIIFLPCRKKILLNAFTESHLRFNFPLNWTVIKWDEHRFYGYVSGKGFKGVDFMAIEGEELYLIEVKNFTDRRPKDEELPIDLPLADIPLYGEKMVQKYEYSLDLIRIIQKYYRRKSFFKIWSKLNFPFLRSFSKSKSFRKIDFVFWTKAAENIRLHPNKIQMLLYIHFDENAKSTKVNRLTKELHHFFNQNKPLSAANPIQVISKKQDLKEKTNVEVA